MIAVFSGKYGGLRAMIPMIRLLVQRGNEVRVYLGDEHLGYMELSDKLVEDAGAIANFMFPTLSYDDDPPGRILNLTEFLQPYLPGGIMPAVAIVYGDRLDALLAAAWAYEHRVPVMHLQAGDISGGVDDAYRAAISPLATAHFCPNAEAMRRLRRRGFTRNIFTVGDHHVDAVMECAKPQSAVEVKDRVVVHLHPDTLASLGTNRRTAEKVWRVVEDLLERGYQIVASPPCNDRMWEFVEPPEELRRRFASYRHLPMEEYVPLLQEARLFIGNSSTAVIEAPVLGVQTVIVSDRQLGREAAKRVWIECLGEVVDVLLTASKSMTAPVERVFTRGYGNAGELTVNHIVGMGYAK